MLQTDLIQAKIAGSKDLLVAFHGLGDSMKGYRWLPQALSFDRLNYLLVNAPDAYYGGFSWFDFAGDALPGIERSFRAVEQILDDCKAKGFPSERTILFGFSQGCLMAVETAVRYPHQLAGAIGVSGWVHQPERLLKLKSDCFTQQKFLITHGTEDPLLRFDLAQPAFQEMKEGGAQIEFHSFVKEHTILEEEITLFRQFITRQLNY